MNGSMIVYRMRPPQDSNEASDLVKKLYGQETSSHKGKYTYRRKGLLDEIPSRRLIRGVIIVKEVDEKKVFDFLKLYNVDVFVREIVLSSQDEKELGIK